MCIDFYDLSARGGCWFVVYIRKFIYKYLNVCAFDYTAVAGIRKVGPVNLVNHTSWVAVVTPTDRDKSVRNRCVIERIVALFVLSLCPFETSVGVGGFVIGLSQISSFFSYVDILKGNWILRVHMYLFCWRKIHVDSLTKINVKIDKSELPTYPSVPSRFCLPEIHKFHINYVSYQILATGLLQFFQSI